MKRNLAALLLSSLFVSQTVVGEQADWNQFRGPTGDGKATATGLPLNFDEDTNVRWKAPIEGKGWSSPVIGDGKIWLTTAPPDGKRLFALRVDALTGTVEKRILVLENENPQFCHPMNSYATPTPVVEPGRVYVHFGAHGTACLDTESGETVWRRRDLECDHHRGPASSPIIHDDLLILIFDGFDVQYVVALDKSTGNTVWRQDRSFDYETDNGDLKKAYCTPSVIRYDGSNQLICPGAVATEALDPRDGRLLWTVRHGGMNASARPLFGNNLVYITNGMGQMVATRPAGEGGESKPAWSSRRSIPKKSSMILLDDSLYMMSDTGVVSCVDATTGEGLWSERVGGDFAASPIHAEDRIYFFSREGKIHVIRPDRRRFMPLATNQLDAGCMASPAVVDGAFILRTETHLYRVENLPACLTPADACGAPRP